MKTVTKKEESAVFSIWEFGRGFMNVDAPNDFLCEDCGIGYLTDEGFLMALECMGCKWANVALFADGGETCVMSWSVPLKADALRPILEAIETLSATVETAYNGWFEKSIKDSIDELYGGIE